jgi:hypothetical protein
MGDFMRFVMALCALILSAGVAWADSADPSGHHTVVGSNLGGEGKYAGDVTVTKTGDTYHVVWHIGADTNTGTGIAVQDIMSVVFKSGKDYGTAFYHKNPDGYWIGYWTFDGSSKVGIETWDAPK